MVQSALSGRKAFIAIIMVIGSVVSGVIVVGGAPTAQAATQSCSFYYLTPSSGTGAQNDGGTYGTCAAVQARTYFYYGGGAYGWETGPQITAYNGVSYALNSSANSVQTRNARVKPINTWSNWASHGSAGSKNVTVTT
jgi:hypothetical protein